MGSFSMNTIVFALLFILETKAFLTNISTTITKNCLRLTNIFAHTKTHPNFLSQHISLSLSLLQVFRIKPPMCITKTDVKFAVDTLANAITVVSNKNQ